MLNSPSLRYPGRPLACSALITVGDRQFRSVDLEQVHRRLKLDGNRASLHPLPPPRTAARPMPPMPATFAAMRLHG